jgi:Holliday junction resolvase-like predicted endonuclease
MNHARQRRRIERALGAFLRAIRSFGLSIRFDAVTVGAWSLPRHLAQAWRPERG